MPTKKVSSGDHSANGGRRTTSATSSLPPLGNLLGCAVVVGPRRHRHRINIPNSHGNFHSGTCASLLFPGKVQDTTPQYPICHLVSPAVDTRAISGHIDLLMYDRIMYQSFANAGPAPHPYFHLLAFWSRPSVVLLWPRVWLGAGIGVRLRFKFGLRGWMDLFVQVRTGFLDSVLLAPWQATENHASPSKVNF